MGNKKRDNRRKHKNGNEQGHNPNHSSEFDDLTMDKALEFLTEDKPENMSLTEAILWDPSFAKSFDSKLDQLSDMGAKKTSDTMRTMLLEMIALSDADYMGGATRIDSKDGDEITLEPDYFGRRCRFMRQLSLAFPIRLIIQHKQLGLSEFARVGGDDTAGFILKKKLSSESVSKTEKKEMEEWTQKIISGLFGVFGNKSADFGAVLKAGYEDMIAVNRLTFIIDNDKKNEPIFMWLVDPTQIRELAPTNYTTLRWDEDEYNKALAANKYVKRDPPKNSYIVYKDLGSQIQKVEVPDRSIVVSKFNHTTNYKRLFDVNSVLEYSAEAAIAMLKAFAYNEGQIANNRTPLGMLTISGAQAKIGDTSLRKFKERLWTYLENPKMRHRIPIFGGPTGVDVKFLNFLASNRDIMYHEWISLLMTICCQYTGTDPNELNFASHRDAVSGKDKFNQTPIDGIVVESIKLGRDNYLQFFVKTINDSKVIQKITGHDDWEFFVTGLMVENKSLKLDVQNKEFSTTKSLQEIRAENDDEKIDIEKYPFAEIPGFGNPSVAQWFMQKEQMEQMKEQQEQQAQMGGGEGMTGAGGAPEGEQPPGGEEDGGMITPEDAALIEKMGGGADEGEEKTEKPVKKSIVIELVG